MRRLVVAVNVVPSSSILVTLMIEAKYSSETSVLTRATRRNIPVNDILHKFLESSVLTLCTLNYSPFYLCDMRRPISEEHSKCANVIHVSHVFVYSSNPIRN
jgi:hypothetical protein